MTPCVLLLQFLSAWGGPAPSAPLAPPTASVPAPALAGVLGAGGRIVWEAEARQDPTVRIEAQAVVRPVPRVFASGAFGRSERSRGGGGEPESTVVQTRWELGAALVVVQGVGSGYIPLVWRHVRERDDRRGDASWNGWGAGVGGLFPVSHPVWMRVEGLWSVENRHEDPARGDGRETDRNGLELGLGFLVFLW